MACRVPGNIGAERNHQPHQEARAASREARHRAAAVDEGIVGGDLRPCRIEAARHAWSKLTGDEKSQVHACASEEERRAGTPRRGGEQDASRHVVQARRSSGGSRILL
jgi:hypothetical protein